MDQPIKLNERIVIERAIGFPKTFGPARRFPIASSLIFTLIDENTFYKFRHKQPPRISSTGIRLASAKRAEGTADGTSASQEGNIPISNI